MQKLSSLSIFFPAHNEEENIRASVEAALFIAPQVAQTFEIIVVDDASTDQTREVVKNLVRQHQVVRLVSHEKNQGYGRAVKTGLESAQNDYLFFTDSDCQFDLQELKHLVEHAHHYDVVIGYRAKRMDSAMRLLNAKVWNFLNRILFDLKVKDIDCAFKLMRREVVQSLELWSNGAMLSAELLIRLNRQGLGFKEVPVTHLPRVKGEATGAKPLVIARALREMGTLFFSPMGEATRQQLSLFALIGLINTGLDLAVYLFLVQVTGVFTGNEVLAKALSFMAGVCSSFVLNSRFTFGREYASRGFLPYLSASLVGLVVNAAAFTLIRATGSGEVIAVFGAAACSFLVGFALVKTLVFEPHAR
jgi:glycosyltransferase involved in cell wall biosynthesis